MSTTVTSGNSISSITGFKVTSGVRMGDNDASGGDFEYMAAAGGASPVTGQRTWQEDPAENIDSGLVSVVLQVNPGGGTNAVAWTVTGGMTVPLYVSNASYGAISSVKIRAAVTYPDCIMTWVGISAEFYKNGVLIETIDYESISADSSGVTDGSAREQILTVTPSNNDNTKVIVRGDVRLFLTGVEIPDPDCIFGQVFVFAA